MWPIAGSRQTGRWGQGRGSTVAPWFPTPRQAQGRLRSGLWAGQEGLKAWFCGVWHGVWAGSRIMSDNAILSDIPHPTTSGADSAPQRDKPPPTIHHAPSDSHRSQLLPDPLADAARAFPAPSAKRARTKRTRRKPRNCRPFRRRRSRHGRGRAEGQGRAIRCLPPAPASRFWTPICAAIRPPPGRCAQRLALQSAAASAKILRLNADAAALRDLRFAVGDPLGPAAKLLSLWRDGAGRPPSLDPSRIRAAAALLDLAVDPTASQRA